MTEEVKEVAEKMSDYAGGEKESLVKNIRQMSILSAVAAFALAALIKMFLTKVPGL